MDAIERGDAFPFQKFCHRFVCHQHEFLDDAVGDVALGARDTHHAPVLVKLDLGLGQIKVNGASGVAPAVQDPRQLFHQLEVVHQPSVALAGGGVTGKYRVHGGVSHALGATDNTGQEIVFDDL